MRVLVKQASGGSPDRIHASVIQVESSFLWGLCYNSGSKVSFPRYVPLSYGNQISRRTVKFCFANFSPS